MYIIISPSNGSDTHTLKKYYTNIRRIMSTLKAESEAPAVVRWVRMLTEVVV